MLAWGLIIAGTLSVAKPVLFSTAIITLTFLPVLSFDGVEGKLFRPLAVTMNFNLLGAVLATLFFVPPIAYLVYRRRMPSHRQGFLITLCQRIYSPVLNFCLSHPKKIIVAIVSTCAFAFRLLPFASAWLGIHSGVGRRQYLASCNSTAYQYFAGEVRKNSS